MTKTFEELKQLETEDYQKRGGNYPKSNIPDSIEVYKGQFGPEVRSSFKNTSQKTAEAWTKKFIESNGFKVSKVESAQDGDYHDDWVAAYIVVDL